MKSDKNAHAEIRSLLLNTLLPIFMGAVSFYLVVGLSPLNPTNISWLNGHDPSMHYLGWAFFRNTDWAWPLGLNPAHGLAIGSSIVLSDCIPILAFAFKPFSELLPETFQYIGIWVLLCFILQSWFGWKLASLITDNLLLRLLICGLLGMFAPPFIKRLGLHAALMGQFLILAALFLNLRQEQTYRTLSWSILLIAASLIHVYLLAMVLGLWIASLIDYHNSKQRTFRDLCTEILIIILALSLSLWQAGYFEILGSPIQAEGFGQYKLNLLSPFDAGRYSFLLKPIPHPEDLEEGFNFLGLGIIFLIPFALIGAFFKARNQQSHFALGSALIFCMVGYTLFALSNQVSIGQWTFTYPLPEAILDIAAIFRSSGRFFWPVFYFINFLILFFIASRFHIKIAAPLLLFALCVQVIDTSAGWLPLRKTFESLNANPAELKLSGEYWEEAAKRYQNIEFWPLRPGQTQEHWHELGYFAAHHRMGTNSVYLGRKVDPTKVNQLNAATHDQIQSQKFKPHTLYVINNNQANQQWLDEIKWNGDSCIFSTNDLIVIGPNWKNCQGSIK